jgi:hypothetical protein
MGQYRFWQLIDPLDPWIILKLPLSPDFPAGYQKKVSLNTRPMGFLQILIRDPAFSDGLVLNAPDNHDKTARAPRAPVKGGSQVRKMWGW